MILALSIIFIVAIVAFLVLRNRKPRTATPTAPDGFVYATPAGSRVLSPVPVPDEVLTVIDEGIASQIARMPADWTRLRSHSDYSVRFVEPDVYAMDGSPDLIVGGTESAGTMLCSEPGKNQLECDPANLYIKVPYQVGWRYLDKLRNTIWYEAEHLAETQDPAAFMKYTGTNDVHPHRD
jgi:hypothetical protein